MAELHIAVIGLGRVGTSIGLALQAYNDKPDSSNHFTVVGNDPVGSAERTAEKIGAIAETARTPADAAANKDLVVIASSYSEVRGIFQNIGSSLKPGAVVLDLSPLKLPSMEWAKAHWPAEAHLVGGTAVINPIYLWDGLDDGEHARADLFEDGSMLLAPSPSAAPDAVELVSQFSNIIGCDVHFLDPAEHDGLAAATEGIPALLGVGFFRALAGGKSWPEIQRLTNPAFGRTTHRLMDTHPDALRDLLLNNRDNTIRQLDNVIASLQSLREVLAENDFDAVEATLVDAENRYGNWLKRRSSGKWDDMLDDEKPSMTGSFLSGMLGGFLADRLRGKNKDDK